MKDLATRPALHMDVFMTLCMGSGTLITAALIPCRLVLHDHTALCELVQIAIDRRQIDLYAVFPHVRVDVIGTETVFPVHIQICHDRVSAFRVVLFLLIILHDRPHPFSWSAASFHPPFTDPVQDLTVALNRRDEQHQCVVDTLRFKYHL